MTLIRFVSLVPLFPGRRLDHVLAALVERRAVDRVRRDADRVAGRGDRERALHRAAGATRA